MSIISGAILFGLIIEDVKVSQPIALAVDVIKKRTVTEFDILREIADSWLSKENTAEISAQELYNILTADKLGNAPFIVDVRYVDSELPNVYSRAHIPGAKNIPWRDILKKENLKKLPKDRLIVIYSYNGHVGSQVTLLLNLLGFKAVNLKWGFTSWACDPEKAPGQYVEEDCGAYPMEVIARESHEVYAFPAVMRRTDSSDTPEIVRVVGDAWLSSNKPTEISNEELFEYLTDSDPARDPFIIDVRRIEDYSKGHIAGAINIPLKELAKKENLKKLPPNKLIVVCGNTGGDAAGQGTAILNLLGYNAVNLKWGITSWTFKKENAQGRYEKARDCMNFPYVIGVHPGITISVY